jgi:hypothetical protein
MLPVLSIQKTTSIGSGVAPPLPATVIVTVVLSGEHEPYRLIVSGVATFVTLGAAAKTLAGMINSPTMIASAIKTNGFRDCTICVVFILIYLHLIHGRTRASGIITLPGETPWNGATNHGEILLTIGNVDVPVPHTENRNP